jgi:pimeloyl-ACP methyl ester carboxylesterase
VTSEPGRSPNVRKRPFTVPQADGDVPAIIWLPERPASRRPLVLLGHGGGMHKESPLIERLGNWLAAGHGIACLAIDLPLHGERTPPQEIGLSALERRRRLGLDRWRERNARATGQAVADWRAAIDAAQDADLRQDADTAPLGPVGYFGVSMGTRFGVPLIAAEPRIAVAVLGLFGVSAADTESAFARSARQVTVPVLFLQQWDDELFPRNDGLALFDLLGSPDKTLHANPGGHLGIPRAEFGDAVRFLARHLGSGSSVDGDSTGLLRPPGAFARRDAMG